MPPMPYYLEKGPMFSVVEDYFNADDERATAALTMLRIEDPADPGFVELFDMPPFSSTNLTAKPPPPYWQDFRDKWLGKGPDGQAGMMWSNYEGDVDLITRRTMRNALEVALGVDADETVPEHPPRHWPIDLYWKCGQNWFEGWVTYRRFGDQPEQGHVVVVFATPSEGSTVVDRPADSTSLKKGPDFAIDPIGTHDGVGVERTAGMHVITHRHNRAEPSFRIEVMPLGSTFEVVLNPAKYVGVEQEGLVMVRPSEVDGGVLATPRPFTP